MAIDASLMHVEWRCGWLGMEQVNLMYGSKRRWRYGRGMEAEKLGRKRSLTQCSLESQTEAWHPTLAFRGPSFTANFGRVFAFTLKISNIKHATTSTSSLGRLGTSVRASIEHEVESLLLIRWKLSYTRPVQRLSSHTKSSPPQS